jgi:hypothetical protein
MKNVVNKMITVMRNLNKVMKIADCLSAAFEAFEARAKENGLYDSTITGTEDKS